MRKQSLYNQILNILSELHRSYPTYNIGRHLSTALEDYGDLWAVSDKEILYALEKYQAELDMNVVPEEDVEKILKDGYDLDNILKEEEDDYGS